MYVTSSSGKLKLFNYIIVNKLESTPSLVKVMLLMLMWRLLLKVLWHTLLRKLQLMLLRYWDGLVDLIARRIALRLSHEYLRSMLLLLLYRRGYSRVCSKMLLVSHSGRHRRWRWRVPACCWGDRGITAHRRLFQPLCLRLQHIYMSRLSNSFSQIKCRV